MNIVIGSRICHTGYVGDPVDYIQEEEQAEYEDVERLAVHRAGGAVITVMFILVRLNCTAVQGNLGGQAQAM